MCRYPRGFRLDRVVGLLGVLLVGVAAVVLTTEQPAHAIITGLSITKSCPAAGNQGATVTCTISVENMSELPVNNLVVTDTTGGVTTPVAGCATSLTEAVAPSGGGTDFTSCTVSFALPITCATTTGTNQDTAAADAQLVGGGLTGQHITASTPNFITVAPLTCSDNNACTNDTCTPGTGCVFTPITCTDNNACTTDTCNPATGCVFTPITCNDNNACTTDSCDAATGCVFTPITCNDNNACTTDSCDAATGCVFTPITCNDNNART